MKSVGKFSEYLFSWYWKKYGKVWTLSSIGLGICLLLATIRPSGNPEGYEYYSKAFRSYDMLLDNSCIPIWFGIGLAGVFLLQWMQIQRFFHNGKEIYSVFLLPMKRKEVYASFALSLAAAVAIYYVLWLLFMTIGYFPITAMQEAAASKEVLYLSPEITLTGLDTHIENGLFLAFRRSRFLSVCFPCTVWYAVLCLGSLVFIGTGVLYACFRIRKRGICVLIAVLCIGGGICGMLAITEQSLGRSPIWGLSAILVSLVLQIDIIQQLERELTL